MSVARIRCKNWEIFETYNHFVIIYVELKYPKVTFEVDEIVCNFCYPRTEYGIKAMIELATKELK